MEQNKIIKYGLQLGALLFVYTFTLYLYDVTALSSYIFGLFSFLIGIAFVVYNGISYRKNLDEFGFKSAWIFSFVIFMISAFIFTLSKIILFHLVDPGIINVLIDEMLSTMLQVFDKIGVEESENFSEEALEQELREGFSIFGLLKAYIIYNTISEAFFSLIIALIIKKNKSTF